MGSLSYAVFSLSEHHWLHGARYGLDKAGSGNILFKKYPASVDRYGYWRTLHHRNYKRYGCLERNIVELARTTENLQTGYGIQPDWFGIAV